MKTIVLGGGVQVSTPFLSPEEAAAYLGVAVRTLRKMGLPRHIIGGLPRYDSRELDEAVKKAEGGRVNK
jgi:hypothetical protein